jgi:hypothetical protein
MTRDTSKERIQNTFNKKASGGERFKFYSNENSIDSPIQTRLILYRSFNSEKDIKYL